MPCVHNQELMDDMEAWRTVLWPPRHPLIPDYGHLVGHYPTYTMVTSQRKTIKTINLYFHAFYNQNIKFFTSHN